METDSQDHIIEIDLSINKISEETLGENISENEVISEEEKEDISGITMGLIGVEVGQEVCSFQETLQRNIEVVVGLYQDQWQLEPGTKLDVSHADNMITLPRIVQI